MCRETALAWRPRNDVYRSKQRRCAVDSPCGTLDDLYALYLADVDGEVEGVVSRLRVSDVYPVEQDGDLFRVAAADAHVGEGSQWSLLPYVDTCDILQQVVNTLYRRRLDVLAAQYSYHSRLLTLRQWRSRSHDIHALQGYVASPERVGNDVVIVGHRGSRCTLQRRHAEYADDNLHTEH